MNDYIKNLTGLTDDLLKLDERVPEKDQFKLVKANPKSRHPFARETHKEVYLRQSYPLTCPKCGQLMLKNGYKKVYLRGLEMMGSPTVLVIAKQKYLCPVSDECPKLVTEFAKVKGTQENHQILPQVKQFLLVALNEKRSVKDIARQLHVSQATIYREFNQLGKYFQSDFSTLPEVIALDDFKAGKFAAGKMSMSFMNGETHELIDIIQSRTDKCLREYFLHFDYRLREKVKFVILDLYQPYRNLVQKLFPNAQVIADPFHVVVQVYRALNRVRIQTMNSFAKEDPKKYRALKRFWKLLLKDELELDDQTFTRRVNFGGVELTDSEVVDRLVSFSDELTQAYRYYQAVLYAMHRKEVDKLDEALKIKLTELPKPCQKAQRTLRSHRFEIQRSFEHPYSNGPLEGINNLIKVIKRVSFGYRSFINFRLRILLSVPNPRFIVKKAA